MRIQQTDLQGCFIIQPLVFKDDRGMFFESFNHREFQEKTGITLHFVQDNQSVSKKGVVRGLHFQQEAFAQAKLVRVIRGKVLDVVVDLRPNSKTFGKHFSIVLSEQNNTQLFIPRGFAHGFSVLEDHTVFAYKCDNYYYKDSEKGIIYNDKSLHINWLIPENEMIISEKDLNLEPFNAHF